MSKSSEKDEAAEPELSDVTDDQADEEDVEDVDEDAPDAFVAMADEPGTSRYQIWLLAAAFLTTIVLLLVIDSSRSWDPYVCDSDEACRGTKECIESYCQNPEVYQRLQGEPTPR